MEEVNGTSGLIGLGNVGTGMAKNLMKKDFKLMVYDIRDDVFKEMAGLGAGVAGLTATDRRSLGSSKKLIISL